MDDVGRTVSASPDLHEMVSPAYVVVNEPRTDRLGC